MLISQKLNPSLKDKAKWWVERKSIPLPSNPGLKEKDVQSPRDLTTLTSVQLNNLMNRVTILADYMETELAKVRIEHLEAQKEYAFYSAKFFLTSPARNKKVALLVDKKAQEIKAEVDLHHSKLILLEALVNAKDRQYKALSRDQTRRQNQFQKLKSY